MKRICINDQNRIGVRTSMIFSPSQERALKLLCEYYGFKRVQDYIYLVLEDGDRSVGSTKLVKDRMFNDLLLLVENKKTKGTDKNWRRPSTVPYKNHIIEFVGKDGEIYQFNEVLDLKNPRHWFKICEECGIKRWRYV